MDENSNRQLVTKDYFTTHSHTRLYILPRLDVDLDETSQTIDLIDHEQLFKYVRNSGRGKLNINNISFVPKVV